MSGIHFGIFTAVSRLKVRFQDDIGNVQSIMGTGFWIKSGDTCFFVTNKHNVDPTLKLGNDTRYQVAKIEVQLRKTIGTQLLADTSFFEVRNVNSSLRAHDTADIAALVDPSTEAPGYGFNWFSETDLATEQFLAERVSAMDIASFIGFPGQSGKSWWDEQWQAPIARVVNIASWPAVPFSNAGIRTTSVTLVSGLSFSGSSGSPIVLHEKGIKGGAGLSGGNYVEPKVIGIMSGHWWGQESTTDMFYHSGLSYFTRSPAIVEVLHG